MKNILKNNIDLNNNTNSCVVITISNHIDLYEFTL